jgi:hypothetical protein
MQQEIPKRALAEFAICPLNVAFDGKLGGVCDYHGSHRTELF